MNREQLLKIAKPILFNTEMVQAILDGRKTATRRCVKFKGGRNPNWTGYIKDGLELYNGRNEVCNKKAPYQAGDNLYVRETWCKTDCFGSQNGYVYKADGAKNDILKYTSFTPKWRPSIHMPKEAARIFLRVKNVRVERVQDITVQNLKQEGILQACYKCQHRYDYCGNDVGLTQDCYYSSAAGVDFWKKDWISLWDSTVKKNDIDCYGWKANPWVWVIEFERLEGAI